jgi:hypothetical protein
VNSVILIEVRESANYYWGCSLCLTYSSQPLFVLYLNATYVTHIIQKWKYPGFYSSLKRWNFLCCFLFRPFKWKQMPAKRAEWHWVHLVRRPLIGLLYQPRLTGNVECGAVGEMRNGWGNRSTPRKNAPVPLCLPQIPHGLTWVRTQAATVGSRRLTTWAMARP